MKDEHKKCKECGSPYIQNKTLQLCGECVYKKNHEGKSRQEVLHEKRKNSVRLPKRRIQNTRKKKPTGEREMFLEIWEERPHVCKNCGRHLGNEPRAHYFSHIHSKGAHPELRLKKSNVDLLCYDCHHDRDFGKGIKLDE